jgi:UDP-glucose 4-epimerase
VKDKKLLITGGTGSFGNTVLDYYLKTEIAEIIIFSRDEKKQEEMRLRYKNSKIKFIIGDVRDYRSIKKACSGVDYIFHAAALKQVPNAEFNAFEAVKTNIHGTQNVIDTAIESNVESLVILSTDKAVYPINAMGISKAMAEKLAYSASIDSNGTRISCTRYGNVMASRGSVIPLFIERIQRGEVVTITDPSMTRFMMSLDESVELVNHAFRNSLGGELFVRKSPAASVENICKAIEIILGKKANIKIIGPRHGEKKHETLVSREELARSIDQGNYYKILSDARDLNYEHYITEGDKSVITTEDFSSDNAYQLSVDEVVDLLLNNRQVANYLA